jgi:hypothetical protein
MIYITGTILNLTEIRLDPVLFSSQSRKETDLSVSLFPSVNNIDVSFPGL